MARLKATHAQRKLVIDLARRQVFSDDFQLRQTAVRALSALSTPAKEESVLLAAAARTPDEVIFGALAHASPSALPSLRVMRGKFAPGSAQFEDVTHAIAALERR